MEKMSTIIKNQHIVLLGGLVVTLLLGIGLGYVFFHAPKVSASVPTAAHDHSQDEAVWTCSMHPQIRQGEPGDCAICGMDLIQLSENTSSDPLVLEMTEAAVQLAQIETTVIGALAKAQKSRALSGKIHADERLASSQVAHIPGRIEKLYVSFTGEAIQKGQKLASIYSPELVTAQRELLEALTLKATNPNLVEAAKKKLSLWKISEEQILAIEESGEIQEKFTLRADASGVVTNKRVAVGDHLKQGAVLFDLVNLSRVWVLFDAYEEDLTHIKKGDEIAFTTPAIPNQVFKTKISFVDPVIDPATRTASLRGEISNRNGLLKPEMFVRGTLESQIRGDQQVLIPKSAVLWTGKRSVVYVKIPDTAIPSYRFQEIDLGERVGDAYLVLEGLTIGDEVVTNGSFTIDAAAQLNNQQSMMNRKVLVKAEEMPAIPNYLATTPAAFKQQLSTLVSRYLPLKDALVLTDADAAALELATFLQELAKVDMTLLSGDASDYWGEQQQALTAHGEKIKTLREVEAQRRQFSFLSTALIQAVQAFGTSEETLYIQHCPMALDDTGADWLSTESAIRNPYFGDKMMKCGTVIDTIGIID